MTPVDTNRLDAAKFVVSQFSQLTGDKPKVYEAALAYLEKVLTTA